MGTRDPRVDAYIAKSAEFAQPILRSIRDTVHSVSPDIEEDIKWGMPAFMYHGILCGMAAFKQHCTFGFWKSKLVGAGDGTADGDAMGQFGRITSVKDLPPKKVLVGYVKKAMELNKNGVKPPREAKPKRKALPMPDDFRRALGRNKRAKVAFDAFSPSHQREYIEWIIEAKTDETRGRRMETALEWIEEGKPRNWKYMKR